MKYNLEAKFRDAYLTFEIEAETEEEARNKLSEIKIDNEFINGNQATILWNLKEWTETRPSSSSKKPLSSKATTKQTSKPIIKN